MDDALQHRIAANESAFRDVNEAIQSGRWRDTESARAAFRCECAALGCNVMVELTLDEYEEIRSHPRRFLVALTHEIPGAEIVVRGRVGYVIVEKTGEAGRLAEETDPRG